MALIVEYHVVADMYPVGAASITAGMLVQNAANGVVAAPTGAAVGTLLGIAGDSALDEAGQTTAYSAEVTIGANGAGSRYTENRVSDFYDETVASQKITVYNGGGKFWISDDLLKTGVTAAINTLMQRCDTTAGEWNIGAGWKNASSK